MNKRTLYNHPYLGLSLILLFLTSLGTSIFIINANAQIYKGQELDVSTKINTLKNDYLKQGENNIFHTSNRIYGYGYNISEGDGSKKLFGGKIQYLQENIITSAAASRFGETQSNNDFKEWVFESLYPSLSQLRDPTTKLYYHSSESTKELNRTFAIDQFMFIEFASETFKYFGDDLTLFIIDLLETVSATEIYEAEFDEAYNNASKGAYWTGVQSGQKLTQTQVNAQSPEPSDDPYSPLELYDYPMTSTSLWAAIAYSHVVSLIDSYLSGAYNQSVSDELNIIREKALNAISYADNFAWNADLSLYSEIQNDFSGYYAVETQILALLANIRLFEATNEKRFISKANLVLSSLLNYYYDSGSGGLNNGFFIVGESTFIRTEIKSTFDNQLFIYALCQLAEAMGHNSKNLGEFFAFERSTNEYMGLAIDNMRYSNKIAWDADNGYVSLVNSTGNEWYSTKYLVRDNMLALFNLNSIYESQMSYNQYYSTYIYGIIGIIVLILIAIIITKRGGIGSFTISKEVQNLID